MTETQFNFERIDLERLENLCLNFDPFDQSVNQSDKIFLQKLGIDPDKENPLTMTNKLLLLLDQLRPHEPLQ